MKSKLLEKLDLADYEIVDHDKALQVAQQWLSVFCPHRRNFDGIIEGKTYLWDELQSPWHNTKALRRYQELEAVSYYIMPDCFGTPSHPMLVTNSKPNANAYLKDFHVFPKNLAWSMAFTHEDGWIGPKFLEHPNYLALNKKIWRRSSKRFDGTSLPAKRVSIIS